MFVKCLFVVFLRIPFLSRNGRESHIGLSSRGRGERKVRLTFGKENTRIDVSLPMTTNLVSVTPQVASWGKGILCKKLAKDTSYITHL